MPDRSAFPAAASPARRHLVDTAVIVAVLGVLPIAWGAAVLWQVLGLAVSAAYVARSGRLVWREAFSTRTALGDAAG